jgi:hypothetical protein
MENRKSLTSCRESNLDNSARNLVAILTEGWSPFIILRIIFFIALDTLGTGRETVTVERNVRLMTESFNF